MDIIIIKPEIKIETEVKDKQGTIKEKTEERVDILICHSGGETTLKHQFKNPKEMESGDVLTLAIGQLK